MLNTEIVVQVHEWGVHKSQERTFYNFAHGDAVKLPFMFMFTHIDF